MSLRNTRDTELLTLISSGNDAALSELFDHYAPAVARYAWSLANTRFDAEELVQDTFIAVWSNARRVRINVLALPWLLVTCRNHARNLARKRSREAAVALREDDFVTDDSVAAGDQLRWVLDEISRLDPIDQGVCELCLIEGRPYKEAADCWESASAQSNNACPGRDGDCERRCLSMKTDPPTGDDFTVFLSTVKERVLKKTGRARPRTRRFGAASLIVAGIAVLGLGTAGTAIAASYIASVTATYDIPRTTNRPSDPPPPSDYDQVTNNELEPNEASLGQLWAGVSGDFRADQGVGVSTESWTPDFLTDFALAITDRCYPLRTADEAAELEQLKVKYESQVGAAGHARAQLYFDRATELCM